MPDAANVDPDPAVLARRVSLPAIARLDHDGGRVLGHVVDPLDPPAQLASRPQRVDQLQVVVRKQRRAERAHGAQSCALKPRNFRFRAYFGHGSPLAPVVPAPPATVTSIDGTSFDVIVGQATPPLPGSDGDYTPVF